VGSTDLSAMPRFGLIERRGSIRGGFLKEAIKGRWGGNSPAVQAAYLIVGLGLMEDVRRQIVDLLPRLRRFGRSLTGDRDRGDDLVQETCARALARLDQWERGTRLDSWLYRIAQNIWIDQRRTAKSRGEVVDIDEAAYVSGEDGRSVAEFRLELVDVERALGMLPDDQRVAIGLVCIQGLSYAQAAEITQVPVGTMMSRLSRGRRALFEAMGGREPSMSSEEQSGG